MTSGAGTRRRSSRGPRRIRRLVRALGWWSFLTVAVAGVWFGGVLPETRTLLHLMLAGGLLGAALLPGVMLEQAGIVRNLAGGFAILLAAVLFGLLPVPAGVLGWLSPLVASARPSRSWWTLSLVPEHTVTELAYVALLLGTAVLVGVWGATRWRRSEVEHAILVLTTGLVLLAGAHHWTKTNALFGVLPSGHGAPGAFFAPFVDVNHFGAAMAIGLPTVIGVIMRERRWSPWWGLGVFTMLLGLVLLIESESRGAAVGLGAAVLVLLRTEHRQAAKALAVVAAAALATLVIGPLRGREMLWLDDRFAVWSSALAAWPDAWFAGTGAGTISFIVDAYRRDTLFLRWGQLHNDPLEWAIETGLIGLVAAIAAFAVLRPRASTESGRSVWLTLGILAVLVNALFEFPLQMPAIGMGVVAVLACRRAVFEERRPASPGVVRAVLVTAALLQIGAAAWMARTSVADRAARDALAWAEHREAANEPAVMLGWVAPWRPEVRLVAAWEALHRGEHAAAAESARALRIEHEHDADTQRRAAVVLWRAGAVDDALETLRRAEQRAPNDWRTAAVRARIETSRGGEIVDTWRQAFAKGTPPRFLVEAYEALPVGLVWVDALRETPVGYQLRLAQILVGAGELETALLAYEQARLTQPVEFGHQPGYAAALLQAGRLDEAEAHARAALSENPNDARFLTLLADVLVARKAADQAIELYLKASEKVPVARMQALRAAVLAGGTAEGVRLVRRMELLGAVDPLVQLELARAHKSAGDARGCIVEIERAGLSDIPSVSTPAKQLLRECGGAP